VFNVYTNYTITGKIARLQNDIYGLKAVDKRSNLLQRATIAARAFAYSYSRDIDSELWKNTKLEVYNDIISGTFSTKYWTAISPSNHKVHLAETTVFPYPHPVDPRYFDPTRQPTLCRHYRIDATYTLPYVGAGLPEPYPGWAGAVIDGFWHDTWVAGHVIEFTTTKSIGENRTYPMFIYLSTTAKANASDRGNKMWFSRQVSAYDNGNDPVTARYTDKFRAHVKEKYKYRLKIADPIDNWSQTVDRTDILDLSDIQKFISPGNWYLLTLLVTPFCPQGYFFSRNSFANLSLEATATLYQAKAGTYEFVL
jgi:hypothetical protein